MKREIDIPTFGPCIIMEETINCLNISSNHGENEDELTARLNSMIARRWHKKLQTYIGSFGIFLMYTGIFYVFGTGLFTIFKYFVK